MFTFLSRIRRQTAVLTALALVASVLVAVPVAAADDPPKPSYTATFDACVGVPEADFADVADSHRNKGDIDCISYYGITKGTGDGTTYSPSESVNREQMALFLTRLADVVGIEMVSDPADPGFTDVGGLPSESQTAIAQLADLGITVGNNASGTTYGPADKVTRGHMALFIARLMDKMSPLTDGNDDDGDWGYTPTDVKDNDVLETGGGKREILSPFDEDLKSVTKETYDAITRLYELGVASGASGHATVYGPTQQMTRASMAGFMAGVLDHSNARPSGLTIQASPTSGFAITPTVLVSVRNEDFAPVVNQPVDTFSSDNRRTMGLKDDGTCNEHVDRGDCEWSDSDEVTNSQGNLRVDDPTVDPDSTRVFYAWIGEENGDEFDADEDEAQTVSVTSSNAEASLKITAMLPEHVGTTEVDHNGDGTADVNASNVHLGRTNSVTITVQLVDGLAGAGDPVAREGVTISVTERQQQGDTLLVHRSVERKTDEKGRISFEVTAPTDDKSNAAQNRVDTITFTHKTTSSITDAVHINWMEAASQPTKLVGSGPDYVILTKGDVSFPVSAVLYDQYGKALNPTRADEVSTTDVDESTHKGKVTFAITPASTVDSDGDGDTDIEDLLNGNGKALVRVKSDTDSTATDPSAAGDPFVATVTAFWDADTDVRIVDGDMGTDEVTVQVVEEAGSSTNFGDAVYVTAALDKENRFLASTADDNNAEWLVSYDKDDIFIFDGTANGFNNGDDLTIDEFEKQIAPKKDSNGAITGRATVDVVVYRPNGESIFKVVPAS